MTSKWQVNDCGCCIVDEIYGLIARVENSHGHMDDDNNARLIAAAPDLLAACVAVMAELHAVDKPHANVSGDTYWLLDDAIKQARGEAD